MNLFEHADTYPNRAGWKENETSRDAALAVEASGKAATLRVECMKRFNDGFTGTADELAHAMGEDAWSIRPRVSELHKSGLVDKTGDRRRADGGRSAHVWCRA